MQKDAELERQNVEAESLQRDKSSLERLLQERESQIQEVETRLQAGAVRRACCNYVMQSCHMLPLMSSSCFLPPTLCILCAGQGGGPD